MATYIGAKKKNDAIKVVEYLDDGSIEILGVTLHDFFKDITDVKKIVKSRVEFIEEEDVYLDFLEEGEGNVFEEYENLDDLVESMDDSDLYYIFDNVWYVVGQTFSKVTELETALEEIN